MHQHPPDVPVVQYFRLNGINFTYCWRAGCTSIAQLAKDNNAKVLPEAPEICMLLLKNPIERFSRFVYFRLGLQRFLYFAARLFHLGNGIIRYATPDEDGQQ